MEFIAKIHDIEIPDPYLWLEDVVSPEVQSWLAQQKAYSRNILDGLRSRKSIGLRLVRIYSRIEESVRLISRGNRYFVLRHKGLQQSSTLYFQDGPDGSPSLLLDPVWFSRAMNMALRQWQPSPDGKLLAYTISTLGINLPALYVLDVATKQHLPDFIPADFYPGNIEWDADGRGFWYIRRSEESLGGEEICNLKLYFHKLGTHFRNDPMVFGASLFPEEHPASASLSKDGRYLLISVVRQTLAGKSRTELWIQDRKHLKKGFVPVVKDTEACFYGLMHRDTIYILTNYGAPNCRLMAVKIKDIHKGPTCWKTVIPEWQESFIGFFTITGDRIFISQMKDAHSVLLMYDLEGRFRSEIALPGLGSITDVSVEKEGQTLFFSFTSCLKPAAIYCFDAKNNHCFPVSGARLDFLNIEDLELEQVWYPSKDGTKIPMFLVHKKDLEKNGRNPTVLTAYGGFNYDMIPCFAGAVIPFLEKGGIYAMANIRGGGEFGKKWHEQGRKQNKQNSFNDFIAAAEYLIENGYTGPEKLAIYGGSNGGLLVGAALTQRPNLFKAAIMSAPVLDMLRYHHFLCGHLWMSEYGNPEDPNDFQYLLSYSPYHNVREEVKYPSVLIMVSQGDSVVHPMHSYKMAAKLQWATASDHPVLIRIDSEGDHLGAKSARGVLESDIDLWSFIFWQLGII